MAITGNMGIAVGVMIVLVIFYMVMIGLGIADYVLKALGLYRIAVRRQTSAPIMAWFPVVNDLLLGKVVEEYDASNGHQRKWSTLLLILNLCTIGGGIFFAAGYFAFFITMMVNMSPVSVASDMTGLLIAGVIIFILFVVIWSLVTVAYTACKYVAVYKLIESAEQEKTIKHFILSALIPLAYGIILLKYAKKFDQEVMDVQPQTLELNNDEYKVEEENNIEG